MSEPPLDYSVSGPSWELIATARDMTNIQELVFTNNLKLEESKRVLHQPKEDDLKELPLDFRVALLRYELRMRFINMLKVFMNHFIIINFSKFK